MSENEPAENKGPAFKKYLLHFIGTGIYSQKQFIEEARRLGVNRAFPPQFIKQEKIDYGTQILLGDWTPIKELCIPIDPLKTKKVYKPRFDRAGAPIIPKTKVGKARIWGRFTVEQVNCNGPEDLQKAFFARLGEKERQEIVYRKIARLCGEYVMADLVSVKKSIPEIVQAFEDAEKETGIKGKVFLSGKYEDVPYETETTKPVGFSRVGVMVDYAELSIGAIAKPLVGAIIDYTLKKYVKKGYGKSKKGRDPLLPPVEQTPETPSQTISEQVSKNEA